MANNRSGSGKMPTWLIILGFFWGFWPGLIFLGIRIVQEISLQNNGAARRTDREWEQQAREASRWSSQRTYQSRTYQPPQAQYTSQRIGQYQRPQQNQQVQGEQNADGTYHYTYREVQDPRMENRQAAPQEARQQAQRIKQNETVKRSLLDNAKLSASIGKGLKIAGNIVFGTGAVVALIVLLGTLAGGDFWDGIMGSTITALTIAGPGAVMSILGSRKHDRVMRCRTYAAMIGDQRSVDIDDLAAAIPTSYKKCCEDLNWMLGEGLLKGMYVDSVNRVLTYPDAKKARRRADSVSAAGEETTVNSETGEKLYPEERRIRVLNEKIADERVSQRLDRLEELTHKILAYADAHPEKEDSLRQFRNHYLPKTFNILESYARMERTGVDGGNISSAMKDVEEIMDKLVSGFEKQLDVLYENEAMDVSTDISVLENMMSMEGLSDLDPFGSLKKDNDLLTK